MNNDNTTSSPDALAHESESDQGVRLPSSGDVTTPTIASPGAVDGDLEKDADSDAGQLSRLGLHSAASGRDDVPFPSRDVTPALSTRGLDAISDIEQFGRSGLHSAASGRDDVPFPSRDVTPALSTRGIDAEKAADSDAEKFGRSGLHSAASGRTDVPIEATPAVPSVIPATATGRPPPGPDPITFPDGGLRAWLVVLGGFCCLIVSFGWINCIGVFQTYYEQHQLRDYSPEEVAWIPSLESFMMFIGGIWVGHLYDNYGPRYLLLVGTILHVLGLMMASISHKYWHFILSQGLCSALGASMIFYPAMSCVVTWFFKKRAFALGVTVSGSGLGGIIFPIMVHNLIPEVGFGWTMRICAFLILGLMIIANLTVASRIPPQRRPFNWRDFIMPFTELPFFLLSFGSFLMFMGLFLPFDFLILAAGTRHVPAWLRPYLIPILNAGSIFGRILPPFLADRFGRFTTFVIVSAACTIFIWALWVPGTGTGAVVAFAVLFGFTSGSVIALPPTLIACMSDVKKIGIRTGAMFSLVAVATLVGNPIGGEIVSSEHGSYRMLQVFAGCLTTAGTICYTGLRISMGGVSLKTKV